jgi:hypothetical protein
MASYEFMEELRSRRVLESVDVAVDEDDGEEERTRAIRNWHWNKLQANCEKVEVPRVYQTDPELWRIPPETGSLPFW